MQNVDLAVAVAPTVEDDRSTVTRPARLAVTRDVISKTFDTTAINIDRVELEVLVAIVVDDLVEVNFVVEWAAS